jgi:hypothetical protein
MDFDGSTGWQVRWVIWYLCRVLVENLHIMHFVLELVIRRNPYAILVDRLLNVYGLG